MRQKQFQPDGSGASMKVVFCIPTITKPYDVLLDSLAAAVPLLDDAGIEHGTVFEIGNPYISQARNVMLRKALDAKADKIVFIDHDVSFPPQDLLKLIQTQGDVVAGTYRYKQAEEKYMGTIRSGSDGRAITRADGCIHAEWVPAGFLCVTKEAVDRFMRGYPELMYGPAYAPYIDLFYHGAHKGIWYGEDYAFSRNWNDLDGQIWLIPDLEITHHSQDQAYPGNFHNFLRRQPGGDLYLEQAA